MDCNSILTKYVLVLQRDGENNIEHDISAEFAENIIANKIYCDYRGILVENAEVVKLSVKCK